MTGLLLAAILAQADVAASDAPVAPGPHLVELDFAPVQLDQAKLDSPSATILRVEQVVEGQKVGSGCWMDDHTCIATARRVTACEDEREQLRANVGVPWWTIAIGFAGGAALTAYLMRR